MAKTTQSIMEMAGGAFLERVNYEMEKIVENILDPNTKATKTRKITVTIELTPDDDRGKTYSNETLFEVKPDKEKPAPYTVYTLGSIVKIVRAELERHKAPLFVNVINEKTVEVVGTYNDDYSRYSLYVARSDVPGFNQGFREIEKAIIELRSLFVPNEGTAYVLDLLSRIGKTDSIHISDNGVTQTVEAAQGVALKTTEKINPRVTLCPFRTFLEVEQPESDYLLRVDAEKGIGLFEADGGVWRLEAKKNISDYFKRELEDLISSGAVVILA